MLKIENSIEINADFDTVFDMTNDIGNWVNLFTEYKESKVLKRDENYILFQLTTYPDENGISLTWTSERFLDKENKRILARRVDSLFPFTRMEIGWFYHDEGSSTKLSWIQEFEVDPASGYSDDQVVQHLNTTSKEQLQAIKANIEKTADRLF